MVLHYMKDGSIAMKLNLRGIILKRVFYSEDEYKNFIGTILQGEAMKRKVIISYKKNGILNQARLTLDRELISSIGVTDDKDNNISKGMPIVLAKDINEKCYALGPEDYLSPALRPGLNGYKLRGLIKLNILPKGVGCEE